MFHPFFQKYYLFLVSNRLMNLQTGRELYQHCNNLNVKPHIKLQMNVFVCVKLLVKVIKVVIIYVYSNNII